ncbi:MAG: right-handed parallel beta-helix repeat-containing protein [Pirellulales bacterium]|nr:right-handed parallel beta-helix repeat-containing protein [Pirellulales bacterium]
MQTFFHALVLGIALGGGVSLRADDDTSNIFYVAPDGNDSWSGKLAAPNADRSDGPLATLAGARDAVRKLKALGPLTKNVVVQIRPGTYRLAAPVVFTAEDSGTDKAPIAYVGIPDEEPVLSGGVPITGWHKGKNGVWTTTVPGVKEGKWYFRSLWVNGKRCVRARTPNEDWYFAAGPAAEIDRDPQFGDQTMETKRALKFKNDDIRRWANPDDAMVVVYHSWTASLHHVASIDEANKIVRFTNSTHFPIGYWKEIRFHVENIGEALDAPGEWYLDRKTGVLTYFPRPGEDMATAEVIAPRLPMLVKIEGEAGSGKKVENVVFAQLSFQHTDWRMERDQPQDAQSGEFLKDAAVMLRHARKCLIISCEIAHTGGYGLWCERGVQNVDALQCHLLDLGAGGVRIGENALPKEPQDQTQQIRIINCFIHDGGKIIQEGCGVLIGQSSHNEITHNEICDFLYSGVSVGWSWGYAPSTAHDNKIEYNHIHHLGYGKLSDMGGIYTLGVSPGTTLKNNLIHDVLAFSYGGWGLYTDEGSSGITLENNIVYRVKDGCFHQHYGKENVVRNNIFAYSFTGGQIQRSRDEEHQSFAFERNIVYFNRANLTSGNWKNGSFPFDFNCYWDASGRAIKFPDGLSFEQWQAKGQDQHGVVADPLFVDPQRGDFTLKSDSPAIKLGFQPIDQSAIGLTGPAEWRDLPKKIERPPMKFPGE